MPDTPCRVTRELRAHECAEAARDRHWESLLALFALAPYDYCEANAAAFAAELPSLLDVALEALQQQTGVAHTASAASRERVTQLILDSVYQVEA